MTGPEHYAEAERLIREDYVAAKTRISLWTVTPIALSEAQVHATLALAAATALSQPQSAMYAHTGPDRKNWQAVAGTENER